MDSVREGMRGPWRLRWGAILAGAVVAIAAAWAGELLGTLIALIEPGESSAWAWLGGILALAATLVGAFAGGWLAARGADATNRTQGVLHGLVVWGVLGTASALLFAMLGGNLALVVGATAGAVRLAIGFAMLSLLGALLTTAAGGASAVGARPGAGMRGGRPARPAGVEPTPQREREVYTGPIDRGDVPPSVH